LMMNPVPWLQMTNMISYQGLVRTFPRIEHPIDLVSDRLSYYTAVEMNGRYPNALEMWGSLEAARQAKNDELINFFGQPNNRLA
ncbi:hypothetical protein, partial [Aeromonas salmonicida]|uniref:hypothetical protein n=1 Tax=Aeromonas salmonicida TaxID=645 RepID=UPI003D24473E